MSTPNFKQLHNKDKTTFKLMTRFSFRFQHFCMKEVEDQIFLLTQKDL